MQKCCNLNPFVTHHFRGCVRTSCIFNGDVDLHFFRGKAGKKCQNCFHFSFILLRGSAAVVGPKNNTKTSNQVRSIQANSYFYLHKKSDCRLHPLSKIPLNSAESAWCFFANETPTHHIYILSQHGRRFLGPSISL